MNTPYLQLVRYKQWADHGLFEVAAHHLAQLDEQDKTILLRIFDHIYVVDNVFKHHLLGVPHRFQAPRSEELPNFETLVDGTREVDDWYASYVEALSASDMEQSVEFVFTNGSPARMRRGEIILHVCLHGTYHRGNAGLLLQKNGITPNDDRMTDFLEMSV